MSTRCHSLPGVCARFYVVMSIEQFSSFMGMTYRILHLRLALKFMSTTWKTAVCWDISVVHCVVVDGHTS